MTKMKKGRTRVSIAKTESDSLRTTIPSHIVTLMKLHDKDSLDWTYSIEKNQVIVTVRKITEDEDSGAR